MGRNNESLVSDNVGSWVRYSNPVRYIYVRVELRGAVENSRQNLGRDSTHDSSQDRFFHLCITSPNSLPAGHDDK
jgi:hypothetical protein